ncbi:unnamed protein product, partial [Rotaria sp. Silwood1]
PSFLVNNNVSATSTDESTTVFDDRLERTLNNRGRYARLGSTGKFYCGGALDGSQCSCCNGKCGPTNGCNCSSCMLLDVQKRVLPREWLVNRDGAPARCSSLIPTTFYCGRRVMPDDGTSDGYCGPTNGPQCTACQILNQQQRDRYKHIWIATYSQFKLTDDIEESPFDREFLMSVYNNTNEGSQLISKIKEHMKDRQRLVHKSIEQQVNDAFAAVFAVYIKHYRRINLAKHELAQTDNKRPHHKLLSLYEYANHVQTLFATTKAQGGDCNELYKQIKTNALFLLSSVQSGNSVPIINEDLLQSTTSTHIMTTVEYKIKPSFKRQVSRWTTAKRVLQLLRNTMNACIRFKKLMLAKKQAIRQKLDNESILNRTIDAYIYGDPYKTITSEEKSLESDELIQYNLAIGWFIKRATTIEDDTSNVSNVLSSKFDIELCINQWLILLLRLVHFYEHVQS